MKTYKLINRFLVLFMLPCILICCGSEGTNGTNVLSDEVKPLANTNTIEKEDNHTQQRSINALVDGQPWQSSGNGPHSPEGVLAMQNTNMNINLQAYGADGSYIALNTIYISGINETSYTSETGAFQAQYKPDFTNPDVWTSMLGNGTISFNHIGSDNIAGTFSFEAVHPTKGKVSITDGTFDIDM